jgi:hypothetical protein
MFYPMVFFISMFMSFFIFGVVTAINLGPSDLVTHWMQAWIRVWPAAFIAALAAAPVARNIVSRIAAKPTNAA